MIIEKNLKLLTISSGESIGHALKKITDNRLGVIFVTSDQGVFEGVLTDGDIRRWLISGNNVSLEADVLGVVNKQFIYANSTDSAERIRLNFSESIKYVPLLDKFRRLYAVAFNREGVLRIGGSSISKDSAVFLIAEIGNNHNGSLELAYELIDQAKKSGANCAKFQMRHLESMYRRDSVGGASDDLGAQYTLDLLAKFQLKNDDLFKAFDYCLSKEIIPLCTPWDIASLKALEEYGMEGYKIASADLTNHELLEEICKTGKPIFASTGMSNEAEIIASIGIMKGYGSPLALLHCNSTYPAPFKDINLNYIDRLNQLADGAPVGYSGHERGISVALAAVAKGAKVIEKHFTLDKSMEGNDHRVSLLPDEFEKMAIGIREVEDALGSNQERVISQGELMNREVLGKSLIAAEDIDIGQLINISSIKVRSPGSGLSPNFKDKLIGMRSSRQIKAGGFFYPSDISGENVPARAYSFNRSFGVPVRYHDAKVMAVKSNLDFLEFHLSYKDLDIEPNLFLPKEGFEMGYIVHSPDLFAEDHLMDLCTEDKKYLSRSIYELKRVISTTRDLKKYFNQTSRPLVIVSVSAFTEHGFLSKAERIKKYRSLGRVLDEVDTSDVEIIFQTMPPFPWYFGGQRYCNLFMDAEEIVNFCAQYKSRICLDVSHSKLACNFSHASFSEFLNLVLPYTAHLHIVDALGVDGEGIQIGEGEIDFGELFEKMNLYAPNASFIPEIWQGHKNEGEAFWVALDRLERAERQIKNKI